MFSKPEFMGVERHLEQGEMRPRTRLQFEPAHLKGLALSQ